MPNYVRNKIVMPGIKHLPLFNEKGDFDFNRIVPMPDPLNIVEGAISDDAIVVYLTDSGTALFTDDKASLAKAAGVISPGQIYSQIKPSAPLNGEALSELFALGQRLVENFQKYGARSWYDWCRREWGTKWNACETTVEDDDTVIFDTAWEPPLPVLAKLSEMYPEVEIEVWCADEAPCEAMLYASIQDGQVAEDPYDPETPEGPALYEDLWGFNPKLEDGEDW